MIVNLMVIQNVHENGKVEIFQSFSDKIPFQWTFESDRKKNDRDGEYFPFTLRGIKPLKRQPGPETKTKVNNNIISFFDDYGLPDGSVMAILLPDNYIPDIIKFKDNPYIPTGIVGQVVTRLPGQIQICYNKIEKRCSVILHIYERQLFGIKLLAKKVSDHDFPDSGDRMADDLFDISLSRKSLNVESINSKDLMIINDTINQADLIDVNNTLNEILNAIKSSDYDKTQSQLSKFGGLLMKSANLTSSLISIIESNQNGGAANQFIRKIFEYANL